MNDSATVAIENFTPHFVAFIDILGFKNRIQEIENKQGNVIEEKFINLSLLLAYLKNEERITNGMSEDSILHGLKIINISDSLVISVPIKNEFKGEKNAAMLFIMKLATLQRFLIERCATTIRGYATKGNLYHEDGIIFGNSYIKAFEGEKNLSHYPRIVVNQEIIIEAKDACRSAKKDSTVFDFLKKDFDGEYFIDYLSNNKPFEPYPLDHTKIRQVIDSGLLTPNNSSTRQKYQWLESYFQSSINIKHPDLATSTHSC